MQLLNSLAMISKKAANVLKWVAVVLQFPLQCQVVESLGHDFKKSGRSFELGGSCVSVPFTVSSSLIAWP